MPVLTSADVWTPPVGDFEWEDPHAPPAAAPTKRSGARPSPPGSERPFETILAEEVDALHARLLQAYSDCHVSCGGSRAEAKPREGVDHVPRDRSEHEGGVHQRLLLQRSATNSLLAVGPGGSTYRRSSPGRKQAEALQRSGSPIRIQPSMKSVSTLDPDDIALNLHSLRSAKSAVATLSSEPSWMCNSVNTEELPKELRNLRRWEKLTSLLTLGGEGVFSVAPLWTPTAACAEGSLVSSMDSMEYNVVRLSWTRMRGSGRVSRKSIAPIRAADPSIGRMQLTRSGSFSRGRLGSLLEFLQSLVFIHPSSPRRTVWIFLGLILLTLEVVILSMDPFQTQMNFFYAQLITEIYWTMDLISNFLTGVTVRHTLSFDLRTIARQYVEGWFLFDLPLVMIGWLAMLTQLSMLKAFKVLKFFRCVRVIKLRYMSSRAVERLNSSLTVSTFRLACLVVMMLLWVHFSGVLWYVIGTSITGGWVDRAREDHEAAAFEIDVFPANYAISFHWAATQLQGNTDVYPTFAVWERLAAALHIIGCGIFAAFITSRLTTLLTTMEQMQRDRNVLVLTAQRYLEIHNISTSLSVDVRRYLEWKQNFEEKRKQDVHETNLLASLPQYLRRALLTETRAPHLVRGIVFNVCRVEQADFFQRLCCDVIVSTSHVPDEGIFSYGMVCSRVYLIVDGDCNYFAYDAVVRTLLRWGGRVFLNQGTEWDTRRDQIVGKCRQKCSVELFGEKILCEAALWTRWVHVGDFKAMTHVSLFCIDVSTFEVVVSQYRPAYNMLRNQAYDFVRRMNTLTSKDVDDLLDSDVLFRLTF